MKKAVLAFAVIGLFFTTVAATCEEDDPVTPAEPALKDYTCKCTYVAVSTGPSAGQPNKEETTTVKGEDNFEGKMECSKLEGKYMAEFFSGTCLIQ